MEGKISTAVKYILSLGLASILLYYSFKGVDWDAFNEVLRECNWLYVALSMLAGALAFVIRGLRWRQVIAPIDSSISNVTTINGVNMANVANMIFPFIGEFVKCGVVSRHSRRVATADGRTAPLASYDKVMGTAIMERVLDMLSIAVLLSVLLTFQSGRFSEFMAERVWGPLSESFSASFIAAAAAALIAMALIILSAYKLRSRSRICAMVFDTAVRLKDGFASCLHMERSWLFFLYTAGIWCLYWLQIVFLSSAVPQTVSMTVIDALFIMLVGSFASFLPVPGGFGAYHYIVSMALFTLYGLPQTGVGIAFATLAHETQAITMLITGSVSYIWETFVKHP